jgi:hypothetical protein
LDDSSEVLIENDDESFATTNAAIVDFVLPAAGEYTIIASRYDGNRGTTRGNYTLTLTQTESTPPPDNTSPPSIEAAEISYGDSVEGIIDNGTWLVLYSFEGNAADMVTINVVADPESDLDTTLELRNADGDVLASHDDIDITNTDSTIVAFTLAETGVYFIQVSRFRGEDGSTSGSFTLTLLDANAPLVDPDNGTDTPPTASEIRIQYGDRVEGVIDETTYEVRYRFTGTASELVTIRLEAIPESDLDTTLFLLDTEGNILSENDDADLNTTHSEITEFVLPYTGDYIILATRFRGANGFTRGNFVLTLEQVSESTVTIEITNTTIPLHYGETVEGSIDNINYEMRYGFSGSAGDVITVSAVRAEGSNLDIVLVLLNADGETITENDDRDLNTTDAEITEFVLPTTGDYTIVVTRFRGIDGFSTGDFVLTLTRVTGTTVDNDTDTQPNTSNTTLTYGDTAQGVIDNRTFEIRYTFEGTVGDIISIHMIADEGSFLDSSLALIDPSGQIAIENDDVNLSTIDAGIEDFRLEETGTYTIVATRFGDADGVSQGAFTLTLASSSETVVTEPDNPDTPTTTPMEGTPITIGTVVEGSINAETLVYRYTFTGSADTVINITMTVTQGDLDTYLSILDAEGREIAFNDDGLNAAATRNSQITNFVLPADGTYTIIATRYGVKYGATMGSFELTLSAGEFE